MNSITQTLLNNQAPALIEIMLDSSQSFSPKLASKKLSDGTMVSPALEDMAPFLEKEEMKSYMISDD
jgi:acetolactate synthase-1/2/3 large subunit